MPPRQVSGLWQKWSTSIPGGMSATRNADRTGPGEHQDADVDPSAESDSHQGCADGQTDDLFGHGIDTFPSSRSEMSCSWISEVPSKMRVSRASRQYRSAANSVV